MGYRGRSLSGRALGACALIVAALSCADAAQGASTTVGFDEPTTNGVPFCGAATGSPGRTNFSRFGSPDIFVIPHAGVLTAWKARVLKSGNPNGSLKFKVGRDEGPGIRTIAEISAPPVTDSFATVSLDARLPVAAGDRIGVFTPSGLFVRCVTPGTWLRATGDVLPGETRTYEETSSRFSVSAVVESDSDQDDYGDDSQDKCLGTSGNVDGCPAPLAADDSGIVTEEDPASTIEVLANDAAAVPSIKRITSVTDPANGTVAVAVDKKTLSYTPDTNYCTSGGATDNFRYTLEGGSQATVRMTVSCVDDPPTATSDTGTVIEDGAATAIPVLSNDTDIDGGPKQIASFTPPTNGTVVRALDGSGLTYEPDADYCNTQTGGAPDTFTYTLNGGSTATVSVAVTCVDDPPVAVGDSVTLSEDDGPTEVQVLTNDTDVDGGLKRIEEIYAFSGALRAAMLSSDRRSIIITPQKSFCNSQGASASGSLRYTVNGGSEALVSVTVTCIDDSPVAKADSSTVAEDAAATPFDVLGNDTDFDGGPKQIASVTQPTNGKVVRALNGSGLTYEPNANYCNTHPGGAEDTFTYTLNGGSTATVSVAVTCVDDPPVAVGDSVTLTEDDGPAEVQVLGNDTDDDGGLKQVESVQHRQGAFTVALNGQGRIIVEVRPDYCNTQAGDTPGSFTYKLNGGSEATVAVTITCADDSPVAVNDTKTVDEDADAASIDVLANDNDSDAGAKEIASVTQPTNGTVAIASDSKSLTYKPKADYCNNPGVEPTDDFTYKLNGGSEATVAVTVTCVDDSPMAVADPSESVTEDLAETVLDVLDNDTDIDGGTKEIASVTQPANGRVNRLGGGSGLTYKPNANYCNTQAGGAPDTFTYTLDGGSTATVSVTVTCVDDRPVAEADSESVAEDSLATALNVLSNDTDVDGGTKEIASATQPANGTVVVADDKKSLTYKPKADYCNSQTGGQTDTFTYKVNGGSQATVAVTVTCVDDPAPQQPAGSPPAQGGPQTPSNTTVRDTIAPAITAAKLSATRFSVDTDANASAKAKRGTKLTLRLTEPATVIFVTEQGVGKRWRKVRIFGQRLPAGRSVVNYSGKIKPRGKQRTLKPGRYRLRMRPSDRAGNKGKVSAIRFTIVKG